MPTARRLAARALYEGMTIGSRFPGPTLAVARWRGHGEPMDRSTDIVIEGYPRLGNRFAAAALASAQRRPVRVAHNLHAPGHVIAAVRAGVPALVLTRHPDDAVVGFALIKPDLTVGQALRGYVRFYEPLLPYRGRFVVARSEDVASDFGKVIRVVNERFGTTFVEFEHTEERAREALDEADRRWERRTGRGLPLVGRSPAVGAGENGARRSELRRAYGAAALTRLRARARRVFDRLGSDVA